MLEGKKILLVITGGIAAYKSLELIRLLQVNKASVVPVMTKSSQQFVTPLSVSAIAGSKVYTELFDLTAEAEMGHIELSRSADIILVAPASADFLSKMNESKREVFPIGQVRDTVNYRGWRMSPSPLHSGLTTDRQITAKTQWKVIEHDRIEEGGLPMGQVRDTTN